MRLVFFDIETGGFDSSKHPIIQIAAIAVDEMLNQLETFERKIQFDIATADPEALLKNSFDREVWDQSAILEKFVAKEFADFLRDYSDVQMISKTKGTPYNVAQLIGHNADKFDGPFLQAWYKRLEQFLPASPSVLCTYQKARHHFLDNPHLKQPQGFKLGELCAHYGIPLANAHDALADCRANIEIYRAMLGEASRFKTAIAWMTPWALVGLAEQHPSIQFARSLGITSGCAIAPEELKVIDDAITNSMAR